MPKMSESVNTFKDKGGYENTNNQLMHLHLDDNKLLEK